VNKKLSLEELEKRLKEKIEKAEELENLLLGNERDISLDFNPYLRSHVLGIVRAVKGALYLALNIPIVEEEKRRIILEEANNLPNFFTSIFSPP